MTTYAEKIQAKKDRYVKLSIRNQQKSDECYNRGREIASHIPFGQPILVGHHSERRSRRDAERMQVLTKKSIENQKKAEYYASRAETYGENIISSDDEEATNKLKNKIEQLESKRAALKASKNYATWELINLSANIRQVKKRILEIESAKKLQESMVDEITDYYIFKIDDNRIQFIFDGKPEENIRSILKTNGFKWSPTRSAWVRQLTGNAMRHAQWAKEAINEAMKK